MEEILREGSKKTIVLGENHVGIHSKSKRKKKKNK